MIKIDKEVEKYLKKKKEDVVFSTRIRNYSKSNFYIAIVYNRKINMYKVLFIPLDVIEDGKIDDFACYQFIDTMSVNYIVESFKHEKDKFNESFCFKENKLIDTYKVEICINLAGEIYNFTATRYIPKLWLFMFESIVMVFQYVPHIASGLCEDLLTLFQDEAENIMYQESFEFDLLRDDEKTLKEKFGDEIFSDSKISQLEKINNKYFSIVNKKVVIVDYDHGITNVYCGCENYCKYVLTVMMAIRNNFEKKFSKIMVIDKDNAALVRYYLSYGTSNEGFKVLHGGAEKVITFDEYNDGLVRIVEDYHELEKSSEE